MKNMRGGFVFFFVLLIAGVAWWARENSAPAPIEFGVEGEYADQVPASSNDPYPVVETDGSAGDLSDDLRKEVLARGQETAIEIKRSSPVAQQPVTQQAQPEVTQQPTSSTPPKAIEVPVQAVQVEEPSVLEDSPRIPEFYVVASGDNLSRIAKKTLGKSSRWQEIADANEDLLGGDHNALKIGMKLKIPGGSTDPNAVPEQSIVVDERPAPTVPTGDTYTVKSGDSLYRIARKLYADANMWKDIFEANRDILDEPTDIAVGQKLKIPHVKKDGTTTTPAETTKPKEKLETFENEFEVP